MRGWYGMVWPFQPFPACLFPPHPHLLHSLILHLPVPSPLDICAFSTAHSTFLFLSSSAFTVLSSPLQALLSRVLFLMPFFCKLQIGVTLINWSRWERVDLTLLLYNSRGHCCSICNLWKAFFHGVEGVMETNLEHKLYLFSELCFIWWHIIKYQTMQNRFKCKWRGLNKFRKFRFNRNILRWDYNHFGLRMSYTCPHWRWWSCEAKVKISLANENTFYEGLRPCVCANNNTLPFLISNFWHTWKHP